MLKYLLYQLVLESEILLPLVPKADQDVVDVTIRYGEVPQDLPDCRVRGVLFQAGSGQFLLNVDGVARYLARNGREIVVHPEPSCDGTQLRTYLMGSVMGALLHQRQLLPLHASAVYTERGALLFSGGSGSGKSTAMNALRQRGYPMLADDITAITLDATGQPIALPGFPATKLWRDSLQAIGQSTRDLQRVSPALEKYQIQVDEFFADPSPIHRIYTLQPHNRGEIVIEPLSGLDKLYALRRDTYRKRVESSLDGHVKRFELLRAVTQNTAFARIRRPIDSFLLDRLAERVIGDCLT